jgi:hypothetical protein
MKGLVAWLVQGYACLLSLYPPHYRSEFGEERQEVFSLALQEAAGLGKWALFRLVLCEVRDLLVSAIKANLRELEVMMKKLESYMGDEHLTWIGLLAGLWPLIFLGPIMAVTPYLPRDASRLLNFETPLWMATVFASLLIGILAGWRKGFPRWVYPYLVILFFALVIPPMGRLGTLLGPDRFNKWVPTVILPFSFIGFGAAALFVASRIPPLRKIYHDVRTDWTRLSFGFLAYPAWAMGFYGGDHLPTFGPAVWLPAVVLVLGAAVYLICRSRWTRILALLAALLLALPLKIIFSSDKTSIGIVPFFLILVFFLPALVELLPRPKLPLAD